LTAQMHSHCSAPAKLIISGEHAVIYGCPALSTAINFRSHCECDFQTADISSFTIHLKNFDLKVFMTEAELNNRALEIEQNYQAYLETKQLITDVLSKPEDLVICCLHHFAGQQPLKTGNWQIEIDSEIPIGRGLGSSASVIISLLLNLYKQHKLQADYEQVLALAKTVESRQHGKSSGLDPATILAGGNRRYQLDTPIEAVSQLKTQAWLIDTGKPQSSTGDAVNQVKQNHANDKSIWQAFSKVSAKISEAIENGDPSQLNSAIKQNQALLEKIGVVPNKIMKFIQQLQDQYNASCKVCGAGSVEGDNAGVVLCLSQQAPDKICTEYGFKYYPIEFDDKGGQCH